MNKKQESVKVLEECKKLQLSKANDYRNKNSRIKHIDYMPRGALSIMEMIHTKTTRLWSLIEACEDNPQHKPNHESIEDTAIDLINYSAFLVAFMRGKIEGQDTEKDIFNK
mgnify:CR=1 FL=1|jgi:hypothetical protein